MLQIKDICKQYKTGNFVQKALDHVSLNLRDNEFVAILGPSGSGKTTLLNIIGGLDRYDSGDLIINGISTKKYRDRDWDSYRNHTIGFVFQSYNLIPHQTVLANVELALTISGISRAERRKRAVKALEEVGLGQQIHKKPSQMSGGQMQRVAIARALVNNPDILLADEPTGALDSDTSIQVMELLKEVARDRLVVMVTHNPELAQQYATRIVNLKDGVIRSDTRPYNIEETDTEPPVHKNMGKSSMSFLTALSLSFNNLRTKKARTLLTSFAGSIGIIGIALILSISNGVNAYIRSIEENTLSEYPVQIQSVSMDMSSMLLGSRETGDGSGEESDDDVKVAQMITGMLSKVNSNDLVSLKTYIDSGKSGIEPYANSIEYTYDISPQIYLQESKTKIRQVHPDSSFSSLGIGSGTSSSSLMSSMMSTNVFYEMPEDTDLYQHQYKVKAGRWPENYQECVLVLTSGGYISDFMLYTLGLRDSAELDKMVEQFSEEEKVDVPENLGGYSYDDILGKTFKLVNSTDYYTYDSEYHVWKDKTDDSDYMKELVQNGEDIKIVGIVEPKEKDSAAMLQSGIGYLPELTVHVIEKAADSQIVKDQLKDKNTDVFTGEEFGAEKDSQSSGLDMSTLFEIDADAMKEAFKMNTDGMSLDLSGLGDMSSLGNMSDLAGSLDMSSLDPGDMDLSELTKSLDLSELTKSLNLEDMIDPDTLAKSLPSMPEIKVEDLLKEVQFNVKTEDVTKLFQNILDGYKKSTAGNSDADVSRLGEGLKKYLATDEVNKKLLKQLTELVQSGVKVTFPYDQMLALGAELVTGYQQYAADQKIEQSSAATILAYLSQPDVQQKVTSEAEKLIKDNLSVNITKEQLQTVLTDVLSGYPAYAAANNYPTAETIGNQFLSYLGTEEGKTLLYNGISSMIDVSGVEKKFTEAIQSYMTEAMTSYTKVLTDAIQTAMSGMMEQMSTKLGDSIQKAMTKMVGNLTGSIQEAMQRVMSQVGASLTAAVQQAMTQMGSGLENAFSIDTDAFAKAIKMNMSEEELSELMKSLMFSEDATCDGNLEKLGYADLKSPGGINIYPKDFESKTEILNILDSYNERMEAEGEDDKAISYTDVVGTLMSSVTKIVNTISYVLVAFVAISLVVSSIMIGVITYISVLERRKEIGILRAIGASKRNISQVFNAETFIIGLCAGLIGIGLTLIALIPGNIIIHKVAETNQITAALPPLAAVVLIALSIFLTLLGGLIPSRKAAKSDPVTALRSE